jgi:predicted GH43/DUF377 family glycosyl hydrolase/lysophospholipase L1-like esterase
MSCTKTLPETETQSLPLRRRVGYVFIVLALILTFQEIALRLAFPLPECDGFNRATYSALGAGDTRERGLANVRIRWESAPDGFRFDHTLNLYGFRGPDFSIDPPAGRDRVLFVGDSFVEGFGAADDDTLPQQFARLMGPGVETINLGVAATGLPEYTRLIGEALPLLRPKAIFLVVFANDLPAPPCDSRLHDRPPTPKRSSLLPHTLALLRWLRHGQTLPRSFALTTLPFVDAVPSPHNPLTGKPRPAGLDDDIYDAMCRGQANPWNVAAGEQHERALRHDFSQGGGADDYLRIIAERCREAHCRLAVVYVPHQVTANANYVVQQNRLGGRGYGNVTRLDSGVYRRQQMHLRRVTEFLDIPLLDTTEAMIQGERERRLYWPIDGHCNALGYRLLARICADYWQDGSLPPVPENDDGRPVCQGRWQAVDEGVVFAHGQGPAGCDVLGARDAAVYVENGSIYLTYDGAGADGWFGCLAESRDLMNWTRHGRILNSDLLGGSGRKSAGYPLLHRHGNGYLAYYVGAAGSTGIPWRVPALPYTTHVATAEKLTGLWRSAPAPTGLELGTPGTFDDSTVSPGPIFEHNGKTWMIYTAAGGSPLRRTLGLACASSLLGPWQKQRQPLLPPDEQVENAALEYEPANKIWFLFTNHIGLHQGREYADGIWVYWSDNPLSWNAEHKRLLLHGASCHWNHPAGGTRLVGLPAIVRRDARLWIFYDGLAGSATALPQGDGIEHCHHDIALASLPLPLAIPGDRDLLDPARFGLALDRDRQRGTVTLQGKSRRRAFLLHPHADRPARLSFQGLVPHEGLALQRFSIGIQADAQRHTDGVEFRVLVEDERGTEHEIFAKSLDPRTAPADRGWFDATLDLDRFAGQQVTVHLETSAGPNGDARHDWALWSFSPLRSE